MNKDQRAKTLSYSKNLHLPPPIVSDLDGDGLNEIILVNKDLELEIFSAAKMEDIDTLSSKTEAQAVYTPAKLASIKLTPYGVKTGKVPIALKVLHILRLHWTF